MRLIVVPPRKLLASSAIVVVAVVATGCGSQGGGAASPVSDQPEAGTPTWDSSDLLQASQRLIRLSDGTMMTLYRSKEHSRKGFGLHLFAGVPGGKLAEVGVDGKPLLPFVPTDGSGTPMTATCTRDGGIAVFTATAHEPPGVVVAWDVTRTTYSIEGARAEQTSADVVQTAAADPALRREMPNLFDPTKVLTNCTVAVQ